MQSTAPAKVRTFLTIWHSVEVWIAVLAFSAIALLLIYDVLLREALMPLLGLVGIDGRDLILYGSQKIAVYLLVVGLLQGLALPHGPGRNWCQRSATT